MQDALEIMLCLVLSYLSKLTPKTTVMSGSVAGAEIITFLAPACKCFSASGRLVKRPVDSKTTSTPNLPQGRLAGSFSFVI